MELFSTFIVTLLLLLLLLLFLLLLSSLLLLLLVVVVFSNTIVEAKELTVFQLQMFFLSAVSLHLSETYS